MMIVRSTGRGLFSRAAGAIAIVTAVAGFWLGAAVNAAQAQDSAWIQFGPTGKSAGDTTDREFIKEWEAKRKK